MRSAEWALHRSKTPLMPRRLLRNNRLQDDAFVYLESNASFPVDSKNIVIPLQRWLENPDTWLRHHGKVGVALENTDDVILLSPHLDDVALICIEFPQAVDGRGYSQAKLLTDRCGYANELRAIGEVLVDQLANMKRCGINAFLLSEGEHIDDPLKYLSPFSVTYQ